jgi:hypothetical protein
MNTENLLANLFQQLDEHIKRIVDTQVADIMQRQAAMAVMDDALEAKTRELIVDITSDLIDESIRTHERDSEHIDEDMIVDIATNALNDYDFDEQIGQALRDSDTPDESRVEEMIAEALSDFDVQERVEVALASDDVWGSGSKFESLVKKVMQNTEFTVNVS